MPDFNRKHRNARMLSAVALTIAGCGSGAMAGGYAVSEQSTYFTGMANAGAAAGGALSSMFWNSAATAALPGTNTESSYSLILPDSELTVTSINGAAVPPGPFSDSGDIGIDAVVSASYANYQLSNDLWVGLALNSPFGLSTKPENPKFFGNLLGYTSTVLTMNANPTLAYKVASGITIGAGLQVEWARGTLKFAGGLPADASNILQFKGDDWAFGATAGILLETGNGSSVGLGWRSALSHTLEGNFRFPGLVSFPAEAQLEIPDIVTLSFRHVVAPNARLLGTAVWTNWSRFDKLVLDVQTVGQLESQVGWDDGWFFSLGAEYDYAPALTLRAGIAYEISPIDTPAQRLTVVPDEDRFWLNVGASYKFSEATTLDFAYSHVFVEEAEFSRDLIFDAVNMGGKVESSVDILSVGVRTKW